MVFQYFLPQRMGVDVGVNLCCGYRLMPEHCLNGAQIGTTLQQFGGKGVAQGVRRDGLLDAGILGLLLYHY